MKTYLVKFTPAEPYFFGNEKTLVYPGMSPDKPLSNKYYVEGEYTPSQSTLLGAIRYILMPIKKSDWSYSTDDNLLNSKVIGNNGFSPNGENTFGKIQELSPVFLVKDGEILIPMPFDHICGKDSYTPFSNYVEADLTNGNKCYFTTEYNAKEGITSDYMKLSDGSAVKFSNIFGSTVRTGINRSMDNKGYFKKKYRYLAEGYSFGVYLVLDDDVQPKDDAVFLGQGKSTFSVTFTEAENTLDRVKNYLRDEVVYCMGDAFIPSKVYDSCKFSVTKTRTYREYKRCNNTVKKESMLYRLISAGSIFIPRNEAEFESCIKNCKVSKVGYNKFFKKAGEIQ